MSIRVYLAEAHENIRDGLRALLEAREGIRVIGGSGDGRKAAEEVCELLPDVVVMDVTMPHRSGIETTAFLRATAPCARVVLMSVDATSEHVFHALQAGARGYLLKDSAGAELADAVRAVHAGRRYVSRKLAEMLADEYLRHVAPGTGSQAGASFLHDQPEPPALRRARDEARATPSLSPDEVERYRLRMIREIGDADPASLMQLAVIHGLVSSD